MDNEKRKEIQSFVKKFIESHEPGTFIRNDSGVLIYSAGPSSLNLEVFFEMLLEDYVEHQSSDAIQFAEWLYKNTRVRLVANTAVKKYFYNKDWNFYSTGELYEIFKNQNK